MSDAITEVCETPITIHSLGHAPVSAGGLVLLDPGQALTVCGYEDGPALRSALPRIERGGVQTAPNGAVQDPAGSAIVTGSFSGAGGASGAIYAHFGDLEPIGTIHQGASIFNRSAGAGRRVLHTYSPSLSGNPSQDADRARTLGQLANAYFGAMLAFNRRAPDLGADGRLLNLVPISAGIFAGRFRRSSSAWGHDQHLDPSYSLAAILLAIAELHRQGKTAPRMTLYYFPRGPHDDALKLATTLRGG